MRTFSVWGGKYDFNLTACVSDADRMLLFRWHIPCIYILFFSRVLRRMATNINFISKWYLMWTSHTRMHVYSRGCTASFIFFMRNVFPYYPWSRCEIRWCFDSFACITSIWLIHFQWGFLTLPSLSLFLLPKYWLVELTLPLACAHDFQWNLVM